MIGADLRVDCAVGCGVGTGDGVAGAAVGEAVTRGTVVPVGPVEAPGPTDPDGGDVVGVGSGDDVGPDVGDAMGVAVGDAGGARRTTTVPVRTWRTRPAIDARITHV